MIRKLIIITLIAILYCNSLCVTCAYGANPWSFVVMGDTRGDDNSNTGISPDLNTIANKIATLNPSAVFVAGDLINGRISIPAPPTYAQQFNNWAGAVGAITLAKIPIYTVRGNHESSLTDGGPPDNGLLTAYYNAFGAPAPTVGTPVPQNGPAGQTGFTWNLLLNNVRMIGVDQYFYYSPTIRDKSNYYAIDQAWLDQQLGSTSPARFTFVMAHEPVYYLNKHGDFYGSETPEGAAQQQVFWSSLGSNGVRMYLCCHVHNVQIGNAYDSNGNLIWQSVIGNGGAPLDKQEATDPDLNITYQDFANEGFALYTVTDRTITINFYAYDPTRLTWSIDTFFLVLSNLSSCATTRNAKNIGGALDAINSRNNATGDMANLLTILDGMGTDADVDSALKALSPVVDGSVTQVTSASFDKFMSTVISHLNNPASSGATGVSTGDDMLKGNTIWAQGYGSYLHEDPREISNGYDASIFGTTLGIDTPILNDYLRFGIAGGYSHDFIRSKDNSGRNDVNNYQWVLYGSYAKDVYYLDAAFAFAYNTYDASRQVYVPGFYRAPKGDYDGEQYLGYLESGYTIKYKKLEITPLVSFQYSHLYVAGYTETEGGAADLSYKAQNYDFAQTGLGVKLDYPFNTKYGILTPELRFKWLYDWVGDADQTTATFAGYAPSFATYGFSPAQSSYDIGAKLTLASKNDVTISINYDLQLQEDLYGHYGYAEVRYSF